MSDSEDQSAVELHRVIIDLADLSESDLNYLRTEGLVQNSDLQVMFDLKRIKRPKGQNNNKN